MANTLDESDWNILIKRIHAKKCTPFIGAGACAGTLPLGSEIAREWAGEYGYPLNDTGDLARVSQFLALKDPIFPKEEIQTRFKKVAPPDFTKPDEPHALLADLNLPIYITTNYDSFMYLALKNRQRDPKRELCRWNKIIENETSSVFGTKEDKADNGPTPANPLVYHLHGHYDNPQSLVLTEDDYLNFLVNLSTESQTVLPHAIRTALATTSLLFIGYSLSDWNFRVLFRGLIGSGGSSHAYPSIAVQLTPSSLSDNSENGKKRAQEYLNEYFTTIQKVNVKVYWGDIKEFSTELRWRWENFKNDTK